MDAVIKAVEFALPQQVLSNSQLAAEFPEWSVDKIADKTGILSRHVAAEDECASDIGLRAAEQLFDTGVCRREDIDYLLLTTQTADYIAPSTSCLLQDRLGLPMTTAALDINLGCSGYVYSLNMARALIVSGQARNVLIITADTYSKLIHPQDRSIRTLFGDAAAATLVQASDSKQDSLGPFVLGTDGSGGKDLIVQQGGMRHRFGVDAPSEKLRKDDLGPENMYMNGSAVLDFTLRTVPRTVGQVLERACCRAEDVDLFVFHQANHFLLTHLRKKLRIPEEKFFIGVADVGNTGSSSLPVAIKMAYDQGRLRRDDRVMLVGFGVGYSWGGTLVRWNY